MFSTLQEAIWQLTQSDLEVSELTNIGTVKGYGQNSHFIGAGQIPNKFGFVLEGLFRYVYYSEEGKEFTKVFMPESSFISSYSAMISKGRSHFAIEALEPSKVLVINQEKWNRLRKENPKWDVLLIKLLEMGYSAKEKREREFLLLDAVQRYRIFLQEYPHLEKRVKQYMVASYLGITPIALSRIRKKMKG